MSPCQHDHTPNAETVAAMEEADAIGGTTLEGSTEDALETILGSWIPMKGAPIGRFALYRDLNGAEGRGCIDKHVSWRVWIPELKKYRPRNEFTGWREASEPSNGERQ